MMPTLHPNLPVGLIVADHPHRAPVLEAFGIDYCCGGKLSLRWFCRRDKLDVDAVLAALAAADAHEEATPPGPLAELMVHLMRENHRPLRHTLSRAAGLVADVAKACECADSPGAVSGAFERLQTAVVAHLDHAERVLFPLIVKIERGLADQALGRRFLKSRIEALHAEHLLLLSELDALQLSLRDRAPVAHASAAFNVALVELRTTLESLAQTEESRLYPAALALLELPVTPQSTLAGSLCTG